MRFSTLIIALLVMSLSSTMVISARPSGSSLSIDQAGISSSDLQLFTDTIQVNVNHEYQYINGKNIFSIRRNNLTAGSIDQNFVAVMDMDGNIEKTLELQRPGLYFADPEFINSTTVVLRNETLLLWNIYTDVVEDTGIPSPFHEVEYNPQTDTFLGKYFAPAEENGTTIDYNDLVEYDRDGHELWRWDNQAEMPYNDSLVGEAYFLGRQRWMHINSIHWDIPNDKLIFNANNLDTFYQMDKTTKQIEWSVGRMGNMKMFNKAGQEVDALFYHAHSVEKISDNRFILYDNDAFNLTRQTTEGVPRLVEIEVDPIAGEAREVWSYTAPAEYWHRVWGDADRLPNGNTLGDFGAPGQSNWLTEVNSDGDIVWEIEFVRSDYGFQSYRTERFYEAPFIRINSPVVNGDQMRVDLTYWNTFKERVDSNGTIEILVDGIVAQQHEVTFLRNWQPNQFSFNLPIDQVKNRLEVRLTNSDGISTTILSPLPIITSVEEAVSEPGSLWFFPTIVATAILGLTRHYKKSNRIR